MRYCILALALSFTISSFGLELKEQYDRACSTPSDINEHVPVLRSLARECTSVVEIGLRTMVSSWGILQGLSENSSIPRSYLGIDIDAPPPEILGLARRLAESNEIAFRFWQANDLTIDIQPTEMLFIDSLHTYCHLTYELETFSPKVSKYIAMHDTSWGNDEDESAYHGDYTEYPFEYDRTKKGLWPAVKDFLERHPEWVLHERLLNNYGLTVLKRRTP
jgi:cephalosporin hydroxylase